MGRACGKVTMKMKHIQDEKVRKSAFKQRNKGLRKKVSEFSKNFGVEACLIVYDGDGDGKPMTWPQDSETIQSMLTKYEQQKIETPPKEFNVKDYFANKKNMVEAEILSVRKKIVMNKYPTWNQSFNSLGREQLKCFMDIVDLKIQECDQRINMLKNMQQSEQISFLQNTSQIQSVVPENVAAPESSEPCDPMNPLIDISEMIDFSDDIKWDDLMPQKNGLSSNSNEPDDPMNLLVDSSEMIDFSDFIECDDLMAQKNVLSSNSISQLDVMHSINPEMQHVSDPLKPLDNISLPPISSTGQHGEFEKLDDLVDKSYQEGAAQLADFKYVSFLSEIEQECAALDAFHSQPGYGF